MRVVGGEAAAEDVCALSSSVDTYESGDQVEFEPA